MGPVLVLGSPGKPAVVEAVDLSLPRLEKEFGVAAVDLENKLDLKTVAGAKWAIVFGGDGAVLNASRRMGDTILPTLAVNFGRLGFLTEVEMEHFGDALDRIAEDKVSLRERMRLTAQVGDWRLHALNDVVVVAATTGRLFKVSAKIERREAIRYSGDGVVIATPTGSTAYSLAAGGPILDPELEAIVITPLCAHALSQRPLVIPANQRVDLHVREGDPMGRVVIDGQASRNIGERDRLSIRKSKSPFILIRTGPRSYYRRLRKILGWGGQPKYST